LFFLNLLIFRTLRIWLKTRSLNSGQISSQVKEKPGKMVTFKKTKVIMAPKKNVFQRWAKAFQNRLGLGTEEKRSPESPATDTPSQGADPKLDAVDNRLAGPGEQSARDRSGLIRKTDPNEEG